MKSQDGPDAYVRRVQEGTHRYAQELLEENERLRVLLATLEVDKARLEEQLLSARAEQERQRREEIALQGRLTDAEKTSRRFSHQFEEIEQQNSNLANLYVASFRLHGTLDRAEVLAAIQEIVANLIGSEEMAVFEMNEARSAVELVAANGLPPGSWPSVRLEQGLIGRAARTGELYVAGEGDAPLALPEESDLTACIPLKIDGLVTGVIALFRLLPQKKGFVAVDHELFELLGTHAATALYSSGLAARAAAGAIAG
jgi:GAF domain